MLTLANRRLIGPPLNGAIPNKAQRTAGLGSGPGKKASSMESAGATIATSIHAPATAANWAAPATRVGTWPIASMPAFRK